MCLLVIRNQKPRDLFLGQSFKQPTMSTPVTKMLSFIGIDNLPDIRK